jgi:hypothetical protein
LLEWAALLALGPVILGASPHESTRVKLVRSFLATMLAEKPPTIADFDRFFGPHDEEELLLQLRYAGMADPLHVMADDVTVQRVNKRLLAPWKYPSLYLCFLRRTVPSLNPSGGTVAEEAAVRQDGRNRVWADTRLGTLLFDFDEDEPYFNSVAEKGKRPLAAQGFLRACQPGACCE